jgi:hypothetical protein
VRRGMKAIGVAVVLLVTALYVAAVAVALEATSTAAEGPALADAQARLEAFVPPPGAQRIASPPEGIAPSVPQLDAGPNWIHTTGYWTDSEPVGAVQAYLDAYVPPESSLLIRSSASTYGTFTGGSVGYIWPELPDIATGRSLEVTFIPNAAGGTSITADAQAVWLEPRLLSSDIPGVAHYLEVTETHDGKVRKAATDDPSRIASVVALANRLPIAQATGPRGCPLFPRDPATLRTVFRRAPGKPVLATMVQEVPMNACNSIKLTVRGTEQRGLVGSDELARRLRTLL